MTAARHYWNASCPLLSQPIERELLREPIRIILQCITDTAEKLKKKEVCIMLTLNIQTHFSCQPRVTVTSCLVYKVIRDIELIDHLHINPIYRIGLILK